MTTRSHTEVMVFEYPFRLKEVERMLPAGRYEIISESELIEGLSFPVYRRVSTFIMAPAAPPWHASTEMIPVSPLELAEAKRIDADAQLSARNSDGLTNRKS